MKTIIKWSNAFIGTILGASLNEVFNHTGPLSILAISGVCVLALLILNKNTD
jgi:uncharacterized membrane protein YkvI